MSAHTSGTIMVRTKSEAKVSKARARGKFNALGANEELEIPHIRAKRIRVAPERVEEVLEKLRQDPDIEYAHREVIYHECTLPNDALLNIQYNLQNINAYAGWEISKGADTVVVAMIDSGIKATHAEFAGRLVTGYNWTSADTADTDDVRGHGTSTASCVAANCNNSVGVSGIAPLCKLRPLKVISADGTAVTSGIANALAYAVSQGDRIANISIATTEYDETLALAVASAISSDMVIVAAASNEGANKVMYPAGYPGVIGVGSTTFFNEKSSFSNTGSHVDVVAPGSDILMAENNGGYARKSGTSFSSPAVAGLVAAMRALDSALTPTQVEQFIKGNASPLGAATSFGAGLVNNAKTLMSVNAAKPSPNEIAVAYYDHATHKLEALVCVAGATQVNLYIDDVLVHTAAGSFSVAWIPNHLSNRLYQYRIEVQAGTLKTFTSSFYLNPYLIDIYDGKVFAKDTFYELGMQAFPFGVAYHELWLDGAWVAENNGGVFVWDTSGLETGGYTLAHNADISQVAPYPLVAHKNFSRGYRITVGEPVCRALSCTTPQILNFEPIYGATYRVYCNGYRFPNNTTEFTSSPIVLAGFNTQGYIFEVSAVLNDVEGPKRSLLVNLYGLGDKTPYEISIPRQSGGTADIRFRVSGTTPPPYFRLYKNGGSYPNHGMLLNTGYYASGTRLQPDGSYLITFPTDTLNVNDRVSPVSYDSGVEGLQVQGVVVIEPIPVTATPASCRFSQNQTVTLTDPLNRTIIYTLDGSDPRSYIPTIGGKATFDGNGALILTDEPTPP